MKTNENLFTKRFFKIGTRWYIDLEDFEEKGFSFEDLEMIDGANMLLDRLSNYEDQVILTFSSKPIENNDVTLAKVSEDEFGATYFSKETGEVWLCNVTKYFFQEFPFYLYIKKRK